MLFCLWTSLLQHHSFFYKEESALEFCSVKEESALEFCWESIARKLLSNPQGWLLYLTVGQLSPHRHLRIPLRRPLCLQHLSHVLAVVVRQEYAWRLFVCQWRHAPVAMLSLHWQQSYSFRNECFVLLARNH